MVSKIDSLLRNYERHVSLPWYDALSGLQKVWFAVYDKNDERRLRARLDAFELTTRKAGKGWLLCDLTHIFAEWMSAKEYKEIYFESPDDHLPNISLTVGLGKDADRNGCESSL